VARDVGDWTAPGAYEVAEGVFRIPLPLPGDHLRAVNAYALPADDGVVIVDAGWALPESRDLLTAALATFGMHLTDVRRFLVTHMHRDHYTQAVALRREYGGRVGLGEGERASLQVVQAPGRGPLDRQLTVLRACGASELADVIGRHAPPDDGDRADWAAPDDWLEAGPLPLPGGRLLEVVETPGHARGHVVF
jgi:glyoxylase-like metal-dependent hydrolase (beta-lactamase superfamily II)